MLGWLAAGATAIGTLFSSQSGSGLSDADLFRQQRAQEAAEAQRQKTTKIVVIASAITIVALIVALWYFRKK